MEKIAKVATIYQIKVGLDQEQDQVKKIPGPDPNSQGKKVMEWNGNGKSAETHQRLCLLKYVFLWTILSEQNIGFCVEITAISRTRCVTLFFMQYLYVRRLDVLK